MRFMALRRADENTEAGGLPDHELLVAWRRYNQEMVDAGVLLAAEGYTASSDGVRVVFTDGHPTVEEGPFEVDQLSAGFLLLDVRSRHEAIEWVRKWPTLDNGGDFQIEIRHVFDGHDLGPQFSPELRRAEHQMRERVAERVVVVEHDFGH